MTYENMDIAPALKQIVDKLEFIAKLNQKCNEIAVCCDLYAPELQVTYKFNKIVKETIGVGVNEKAVLRFYQTALSFTSISIFPW